MNILLALLSFMFNYCSRKCSNHPIVVVHLSANTIQSNTNQLKMPKTIPSLTPLLLLFVVAVEKTRRWNFAIRVFGGEENGDSRGRWGVSKLLLLLPIKRTDAQMSILLLIIASQIHYPIAVAVCFCSSFFLCFSVLLNIISTN